MAIPKKLADMSQLKNYILFVGNPGVGKSTLLNCLMQSKAKQLEKIQFFKSGVSFGSGITYQLDEQNVDGITYLDTPGLEDVQKRKQAAQAITKALKKDGRYRVVFVVILESGRIRPSDLSVISLVLESANEITHYGIIFNRTPKRLLDKLSDEEKYNLLSPVRSYGDSIPIPLFLPCFSDLEDEDMAVRDIPELEDFVENLFKIFISSENVTDISGCRFDEMVKKIADTLKSLEETNQNIVDKMKKEQEEMLSKMNEVYELEKNNLAASLDLQKKETKRKKSL